MEKKTHHLTRGRYLTGRRCKKRLWLECHRPDLAAEGGDAPAALAAKLKDGRRVGVLARGMFPGGVLVSPDLSFGQALAATSRLLPTAEVLYEPAFSAGGLLTRSDILVRIKGGDGFKLVEVKLGAGLKDRYIEEVAYQALVLRLCGVNVRRVSLVHLNREYLHRGDQYDLDELFTEIDLTAKGEFILPAVRAETVRQLDVLRREASPEVAFGEQCPECPFASHCNAAVEVETVSYPIGELPHLSPKKRQIYLKRGLKSILDITEEVAGELTPFQKRAWAACRSGEIVVDRALLKVELDRLAFPIHFLDFESYSPALPLAGGRPWGQVPFQWSDHILQQDETLEHHEFLADGERDPLGEFARNLLLALGEAGSIVVYNKSFEISVMKELAHLFPARRDGLEQAIRRVVDLLEIMRKTVAHRDFHGSYSLKKVLPAMVGREYADLGIQHGRAASGGYFELMDEDTSPERKAEIRSALLAYCGRDTEAMLFLCRKLADLAGIALGRRREI